MKKILAVSALALALSFSSTVANAACAPGTITVADATSQLAAALKAGNTAKGRAIVNRVAREAQKAAACDVALAALIGELIDSQPTWVQTQVALVINGRPGAAAPGSPS